MRFSIITVSFNSAPTISRTIDSVISQTYDDYEYIIVDGGSKDGTVEIIKYYQPQLSDKLKWVSEPDSGIFSAMNKGIKMASGDIVGIVNSDDWLEMNSLEVISQYYDIANNDCDNNLYCGAIRYHYDNYSQILMPNEKMCKRNRKRLLLKGLWHPAIFVPRQVYERIGVFDEDFKIMADADFVYRCYKASVKFVMIPKVISNMSTGGASTAFNPYLIDYKKLLHKNRYYGFKYYKYYIMEYLRAVIRCMSPSWIVKIYRATY